MNIQSSRPQFKNTHFLFPSFGEEYSLISFSHNTRCCKRGLDWGSVESLFEQQQKEAGPRVCRGFSEAAESSHLVANPSTRESEPRRGAKASSIERGHYCANGTKRSNLFTVDFSQPPSVCFSLGGSSRTDWVTRPRLRNMPPEGFGMTH